MKRIILLFCSVFTLSVIARSATPDTLTLTNIKSYIGLFGRDYLANVIVGSSTLPDFNVRNPSGVNILMNTGIVYDTVNYPTRSRFYVPTYSYADSTPHNLGNIHFYGDNLTLLTSNYGLISRAEQVDATTIYANRTGGGIDTFTFADQINTYNNPYYQFPIFPVTYGRTWSSDYIDTINMTVLDRTLSLVNAPAKMIFHHSRLDSFVNFGTIKLMLPDSTVTKAINVLQDKVITTEKDSFLVNGSPASTPFMLAMGISQGMTTNTYSYCFYRVGRLTTPLVQVWYTDGTFSTISRVWVDTTYQATLATSAVPVVANANVSVTVFPNPVTNRIVNIQVANAENGSWSCDLINISGQVVATGNLSLGANQTITQLSIPAALTPGIYYLRISNKGVSVALKALNITN
jgi:hypothetical protein